jgi:hypothetical protein
MIEEIVMLQIIKINNSGEVSSEYVFIEVVADCNAGDYLLTDSTYGADNAPSNKLRHVFFFPSKEMKAGEYIVLWTKSGTYNLGKTSTNSPQHNLHWNLKETVWNITGDKAFLFKAPRAQRSSHSVGPKAK